LIDGLVTLYCWQLCHFLLSCLDALAKDNPELSAEPLQLILDFAEKHLSYFFPSLSVSDRALARGIVRNLPRSWNLSIC